MNILTSFIITFIFTIVTSTYAAAQPTVTSNLSGLPKNLSTDSRLMFRTVSLKDGSVSKSTTVKKRASQFSISASSTPNLIGVSYFSKSEKKVLGGVSKKFLKGLSAAKLKSALTIKLAKPTSSKSSSATKLKAAPLTSGVTVGIPIDGIKVSGPGTFTAMSKFQVQMLITSLTNDTSCYNKEGGFVLVDLDPAVKRARKFEFDLCASGKADPKTCVQDLYQDPLLTIDGTLSSNGSNATLALTISNQAGTSVSEISAIGSVKTLEDWEKLTKEAAKKIGDNFCNKGTIQVSSAQCVTPSCSFSCGATAAIRTLPTIVGSANGPVGTKIAVGMDKNFATINCGNWSVEACTANVCCKRTSEAQSESTNFEAVLDLFQGNCQCPGGSTFPYSIITQLTGSSPSEIEKLIECPS